MSRNLVPGGVSQGHTPLIFRAEEVRRLLNDSRKADVRCEPYGGPKPGVQVGLFLVKDDGIYLISNARRERSVSATGLIAYAQGFGPLDKATDRGAQYDKIREAAGGDDFCYAIFLKPHTERLLEQLDADFVLWLGPTSFHYELRMRGKQAS